MRSRKILLWAVLGFSVFLACEAVLWLTCWISSRAAYLLAYDKGMPISIPDAGLRQRPNPAYPEHDQLGFRNPAVPSRAAIVALGDSQTYGFGMLSRASWPARLAVLPRL